MKKTLILANVVFAFGFAVAIALQFAGLISFNVFGLPALIGGGVTSGIVALVLSDYSRRPSLRVRKPQAAVSDAPAAPCIDDPVTMWTYTTRNA